MMTLEEIGLRCLQRPGSTDDYPFGPHCRCIKIGGRVVAQLFLLHGVPTVTLKCTPEEGLFWRARYAGTVVRGYHCPPMQQPHFNTFPLDGTVADGDILAMIDHAYATVIAKLPKAIRAQFL